MAVIGREAARAPLTSADINDGIVGAVDLQSTLDLSSKTITMPSISSLDVTGNLTVDTNTLYVDATNNRVGIGTTSPVGRVHSQTASAGVNANSNFRQFVAENSGNAGITILSGASSLGTLVFGDSGSSTAGRVQYDHSNDSLAFSNNNSESMRITSAGNVGIGTSSPATKLELVDANNVGLRFGDIAAAPSSQTACYVGMSTTAFSGNNGDLVLYPRTSAASDILLMGGNVGVGTTNPQTKLHISSGVNSTPTTFRIENTDTSIETAQDVNTIEFYTNDASASGTGVTSEISQVAINAGNQYALTFSTYNASLTEKMRIDHDGNVGLLTGSPLSRLHVNGGDGNNIRYQGATHTVAMGITSTDPFVGSLTNGPLRFLINASERARLDLSGNLLVGTTSVSSDPGVQLFGAGNIFTHIAGTSGADSMRFYRNSVDVGSITTTGTTTTYNTSSDARLKENIADAESASELIDAIQVRSFDWKADGSHQRYGMVAQELLEVAPEAVSQPEDPDEMMGVDYSKLVPMLVKEIQSLRARVAQLEGA